MDCDRLQNSLCGLVYEDFSGLPWPDVDDGLLMEV